MYCPGSQKTTPEQLLRAGQNSTVRTLCSESLCTNCFLVSPQEASETSSAGRPREVLELSSEIKIFFFLAEQGGKARELSGDGRTVGLSSRLYEGQEENQRIPTERET